MMQCERIFDVEELVLDNLSRARTAETRAHLAACKSCQQAHELFASERALFRARARAVAPPPRAIATRILEAAAASAPSRNTTMPWTQLLVAACAVLAFGLTTRLPMSFPNSAKLDEPARGEATRIEHASRVTDALETRDALEGSLASFAVEEPCACIPTASYAGAGQDSPDPFSRALCERVVTCSSFGP
jgi:anti-sigma factor RsiW